MPNDGRRIYTEVRDGVKYGIDVQADVYKVLGLARQSGGYDVSYACCDEHGKTNKWSAAKPVRYNKISGLTAFEIENTDIAEGVYYGLKMSDREGTLKTVHDCTFDYLPPRVGVDWCRLTDFEGYDHAAKPVPATNLPPWVSTSSGGPREISILISTSANGTNGIDFTKMTAFDFANMYPCILISDTARTRNYVRAMKNEAQGAYTTMKFNNAWWTSFNVSLLSDDLTAQNFLLTKADRIVSIFFITKIVNTNLGYDYRNWVEVSDSVNVEQFMACPNAVAQTIPFGSNPDANPDIIFSISNVRVSAPATVKWDWAATGTLDSADDYDYKLNIYQTRNGITTLFAEVDKTISYSGSSGSGTELKVLGLNAVIDPLATYEYSWQAFRNYELFSSGNGDAAWER